MSSGQGHPDGNLLHSTTHDKARAINMVGFRVGPKTLRSTGYCAKDDYDCIRAEAFLRSEETLEKVRAEKFPKKITRVGAVFFAPEEGSSWIEEPEIFLRSAETDWRTGKPRPEYDFGFGKTDLFVVDAQEVDTSCDCGVGDNVLSDEVFEAYRNEMDPKPLLRDRGDPEKLAKKFWQGVKEWSPSFDAFQVFWGAISEGEPAYEMTEIWCPCSIPRSAIVKWYGSHNPVPNWKGSIDYVWEKA